MDIPAVYAGSFDPFTVGHLDVLMRARSLFGHVIAAIAVNPEKRSAFPAAERATMIREATRDSGIEVVSFEGLLTSFMRERSIRISVRGLRSSADLPYEMEMAAANRMLYPEMDTVFLASDGRYAQISATLVRDIAAHGGDISRLVPPAVVPFVAAKYR